MTAATATAFAGKQAITQVPIALDGTNRITQNPTLAANNNLQAAKTPNILPRSLARIDVERT